MKRYSLKIKFLSMIISVFMLAAMVPCVFAGEEDSFLDSLAVKDISIINKDDKGVSGTAILRNNSDYFFPELWYATEMYIKIGENSNLINKEIKKFEIGKREVKTVAFSHKFPAPIAKGNYQFMLRIYNRTGIPLGFKLLKLEDFGGANPFISYDPERTFIDKDGAKVAEMSGPTYKSGESPKVVIPFKNMSNKQVTVTPFVEIYERSYITNSKPVKSVSLDNDKAVLQAGEEKEIVVNVPGMDIPESYLVKIVLKDTSGAPISSTIEARYVVAGTNAKIANSISTVVDNKIQVSTQIVGPADGTIQKGAKVKIDVYEEGGTAPVTSKEEKIALSNQPINYKTEIPIKDGSKKYDVSTEISHNGKVLDSTKVKYDVDKIKKDQSAEGSDVASNVDSTKYLDNTKDSGLLKENKIIFFGLGVLTLLLIIGIVKSRKRR